MGLFDTINAGGTQLLGVAWPTVWAVVRILVVSVVILLCVAYLILWERKLIGWMHVRLGPNRVGPAGLLQPIADVLKLLLKEVIQPTAASKWIYVIAPIMTVVPAFAVWAVIPFQAKAVLGDINAGLLYIMAISSIGVYGVILAGWASNSKYAFLGAMRAAAQMVSYEISMGFALVVVLMVAGTLNMSDIVHSQQRGMFAGWGINFLSWNWLPLLPMFVVYFISGIAETNRHPFDVVEGESEIVAGHMIDYSGMAFALFFLAEYINMIVISAIAATLFLGGWDAPFGFLSFIPGVFWFVFKVFLLLSVFIWARATFPRYRYDQIMRLGWKVFLPVSVIWVVVVGFWIMSPLNIWK
ncbi:MULTISPECIES: NADH-quinone oxidoreductase subunit NuoH [Caballeronia]|jgi:NADH-quinone oxidoreductase subunit H|uniref:NADH-quinone oxidoreductase subunit H n=1 Tax=Caballeronia zhejiangensis TaxID=871203 RepID=A0A656QA85_9BURK|nr:MULTISPECIES: NADH-quinone oxidoreductase subunit NuoH [Caballeronia]EKS72825.1 NADH:ubiquinone oxidoreductase subunit H [Burkholderia sp. SJ98]KDR25820.1 NADH:ubiquinone oxidoreductase subunit H [Caballeronia zhejiangensis]MCG7405458.1 NADH-quinone oxidoreductase subunit NuoH [Caballeronia zhejiangensis]MCI1046982.1 NADH-quinone oxidoreductase subunit NuoH [Caballeronia zhejiangensis]MDR5765488.1 NADH-quinone oxidoreductase subunit NuoH [Caballeronia sp. LZ028]